MEEDDRNGELILFRILEIGELSFDFCSFANPPWWSSWFTQTKVLYDSFIHVNIRGENRVEL